MHENLPSLTPPFHLSAPQHRSSCAAVRTGELSITQQQLHSIQEDLQGTKGQLGSVSKELEHKDRELQQAQQLLQDTQGELGLTRSQLELLHRELHSEKRKLADTRSQLEVKDSALRQGQDFWEFSD
eukprot:jgi/Astpho2/6011/fgenesh1_pg.00084_%23_26_t